MGFFSSSKNDEKAPCQRCNGTGLEDATETKTKWGGGTEVITKKVTCCVCGGDGKAAT